MARWPGERAHARALLGLEVLKQLGSVCAWAAIQHLSLKSRFPALKEAARKTLAEIAAVQGLSVEGFLDQLVPDHGLDASHQRRFVFGEQTCDIVVDADLQVSLRDSQGQLLQGLSKGAGKNAAKTWKGFKKDLEKTLRLQAQRLEIAMGQGQRWSIKEFQELLQDHPVMGILAQRLVWGLWQETRPPAAFQLSEGS